MGDGKMEIGDIIYPVHLQIVITFNSPCSIDAKRMVKVKTRALGLILISAKRANIQILINIEDSCGFSVALHNPINQISSLSCSCILFFKCELHYMFSS